MTKLVLNATTREGSGKSASRRLRRLSDSVPGIIYGGNEKPQQVTFPGRELRKILEEETFFSHIVTIQGEHGKEEKVLLRDIQRHPVKGNVTHLDFMRILEDRRVTVRIPVHLVNEDKCIGVKNQGGNISRAITEVEVSCLSNQIPDFIEVDLAHVQVREAVHLSDLELPKGVELTALKQGDDHDLPVVSVQQPRGGLAEDEEEGDTEADDFESTEEQPD